YYSGASVVVEISDDGAGLDRAAIVARAQALGLPVSPGEIADQELLSLIFRPGFSTAREVTDLSGRGVGLDVVRRDIEALRGGRRRCGAGRGAGWSSPPGSR